MTAQEVIKRLRQDGWHEVKQTGSHKKFKHDVHGASAARNPHTRTGIVTVPMHRGDIPKGTLKNIFRQAGWDEQP